MRRATSVLWVILLPAEDNFFRGAQFPWARIFLKTFLLRRATAARRDIFLQAAANFFRDPQSPWVSSFGSLRHLTASFRPPRRFFIVSEDFTAAFSVGTSRCSTADCIISGVGSIVSGLVSKFMVSISSKSILFSLSLGFRPVSCLFLMGV
jgi:hypothetical protein